MRKGLHEPMERLLREFNARGGYALSLVCTDQGLPLASAGQGLDPETLSAFTSLFDDVVVRALRDLELKSVEELTLLEPGRGRYVVRPLELGEPRLFLLIQMDPRATWRRNTRLLCEGLTQLIRRLDEPQTREESA